MAVAEQPIPRIPNLVLSVNGMFFEAGLIWAGQATFASSMFGNSWRYCDEV